jgi:hypothetical protein
VVEEDLSRLSEEGSEYDSEDDKKALKEAKKKWKVVAQMEESSVSKTKTNVQKEMGCLSKVSG